MIPMADTTPATRDVSPPGPRSSLASARPAGRAWLQRCACGGRKGPSGECAACRRRRALQPRLTVGPPGDRYEREADRLAEAVMAAPADTAPLAAPVAVQRVGSGEGAGMEAPASVDAALASTGRPLDGPTREFMEVRLGHDFSGVRVHTDARAAASAQDVQARAYTVGRDVVFGAGAYQPRTGAGRRLLAHELTHVVQQQGGAHGLQREVKKAPCPVHVYDASDVKDTAVIPKDGSGIGVTSVDDMVSKVNAYVGDPKNACSCVNRLEINGHGTDGYQSVGNGAKYVNDDKALVHNSKQSHLDKLAGLKLCSTGLFMMMGCHLGRGDGKILLSKVANVLPGKLIGGSQHYTGGQGLGQKKVVGTGDKLDKEGKVDMGDADPFLTSPFVRWHIVIGGKEYVINGDETTSTEGKAKLKAAESVKVKTPEGETVIK